MRVATYIVVIALLAFSASAVHAADITTTGGLTLYMDGPSSPANSVPNNLALVTNGATPFALDAFAGGTNPSHQISHLNDGLYGNANSWIGGGATGTSGPFAGVNLGGSFTINSFAFGRSNVTTGDPCAGGVCTDRSLGTYTLQVTTAANPTAATPDAQWTTIGTIDYSGAVGPPATTAASRHQYNFAPVMATGLRLINPNTSIAIDEIEVYANNPAPVGLTLSQTGPAGPANSVPNNLALATNGATPFARDVLGGGAFAAHQTVHLNDGLYGNSNSWIGDTDATFAGVDLGEMYFIDSIAFGRDNTGGFNDRAQGNITIQYTSVDDPDAFTPNSDWFTLDVLNYDALFPGSPALRHEYDLDTPVIATGIRLITADGGLSGGVAIDELEVFGRQVPEPASVAIWSLLGLVAAGFSWRRHRRCSP